MEKIILKAEHRKVLGKKVKALRREGKLPAVIFGHKLETTPIVLDMRDASRTLAGVGSSTLVTIQLDGKEHAALVRERQHDVMLRTLLHVDFQAVSMTETLRTSVSIILSDEDAPAVKAYGAMIIQNLESVEIECLPQDLPERIEVDLSSLKEIGDHIMVKDLPALAGVEILEDPETVVVVATALAEAAVEDELAEGAEPELVGASDEDEDAD